MTDFTVTSVICPVHGEFRPSWGTMGVSPEKVSAEFLRRNRTFCGRCDGEGRRTLVLLSVEALSGLRTSPL